MKKAICRHLIAIVLLATSAGTFVVAQETSEPQTGALRVFLDCGWYCDFDHLRTEITFVNWVRDRADAQVHVLVTQQTTGGGGYLQSGYGPQKGLYFPKQAGDDSPTVAYHT